MVLQIEIARALVLKIRPLLDNLLSIFHFSMTSGITIPKVHKAVTFDRAKTSSCIITRETPSPKRGEVLIKVRASAVNPADWKVQSRGYFNQSDQLVFGIDGSGEIVQLGEDVTDRQIGDRVFFSGWYNRADTGTFQEYAICLACLTCRIPQSMAFEDTAGIMTPTFTAYTTLFHTTGMDLPLAHLTTLGPDMGRLETQPDELEHRFASTIFILGGSSNVGQYTIQFAHRAGFRTIITTASSAHDAHLLSLGATHVLRRDSPVETFVQVAASARGSYNSELETLVMDCIAIKETQEQGSQIILSISPSKGGFMTNLDILCQPVPKSVQIRALYAIPSFLQEISVPFVSALEGWLADGSLRPVKVEVETGMEKLPEAVARLRNGVSGLRLVVLI